MNFADLFPETIEMVKETNAPAWTGVSVDKWQHHRVNARLVPAWSAAQGWQIGWFAQVDKCMDEWHPGAPTKHLQIANYPWYRLDELPSSNRFAIAAGSAARALKIVLEQMLGYVEPELHAEVHAMQEQIERQARDWLCGRAA